MVPSISGGAYHIHLLGVIVRGGRGLLCRGACLLKQDDATDLRLDRRTRVENLRKSRFNLQFKTISN